MTKRAKIVAGVIVGVVAVTAVAVALKSGKKEGVTVRTAKVVRRELVALVTANGTVQAKTKVDLSANIMGQITRLNVQEGDEVKLGDLLLVIDQTRYDAAVEGSRAGLESLQAELARVREAAAQAGRDLEHARAQHREGIISKADLDRAASGHEQALAAIKRAERQVEQAKADLRSTQDALTKTEIRAPMSGIVTRRNIEQGEVVVTGTMNNPGTVLMTISDMSTVEAVLEVDQTDVPQLRLGQKAQIAIDAFPGESFPGVVSEIGSSPIRGQSALGGAATGTDYQVKVTLLSHPKGIRPGLTVTADVTTQTRADVLAAPIGALVLRSPEAKGSPAPAPEAAAAQAQAVKKEESVATRVKDVEGVYVVEGNKVAFRHVKSGIKGETDVEITEGLSGGEEIVVGPFKALRELKPGSLVRVDNSAAGSAAS